MEGAGGTRCLAFSPDGKRLAARVPGPTSSDAVVVWDVPELK